MRPSLHPLARFVLLAGWLADQVLSLLGATPTRGSGAQKEAIKEKGDGAFGVCWADHCWRLIKFKR